MNGFVNAVTFSMHRANLRCTFLFEAMPSGCNESTTRQRFCNCVATHDGFGLSSLEEPSLRFKYREIGHGRRLGEPEMEISRRGGLTAAGRAHHEFSA